MVVYDAYSLASVVHTLFGPLKFTLNPNAIHEFMLLSVMTSKNIDEQELPTLYITLFQFVSYSVSVLFDELLRRIL